MSDWIYQLKFINIRTFVLLLLLSLFFWKSSGIENYLQFDDSLLSKENNYDSSFETDEIFMLYTKQHQSLSPRFSFSDVKYFLINLERRPERLWHFMNQLTEEFQETNITHVKAFDALDPYAWSPEETALFENADFFHQYNNRSIIGCFLSHIFVLQEIVRQNISLSVVFEDDVILTENFFFHLENVITHFPSDAEFIFLGHSHGELGVNERMKIFQPSKEENYSDAYVGKYLKNINNTTQAYLITLKGALNFLIYLKQKGILRAIDHQMNDYLQEKDIFYGTYLTLTKQNQSILSDINVRHFLNHGNNEEIDVFLRPEDIINKE